MSAPAETDAPRGRAPLLFAATCASFWLFFAAIAWLTPIVLDDWFEAVWIKQRGLSPGAVWDYASYNYLNYNPRLGETLLLIVNGPRVLHVLVTPTVELALLFVVFALGHGRWPRATRADVQRLLIVQALLFLTIPSVGLLYYYRPYTTNYLFGSFVQLSLFVPFRLELAAAAPRRTHVVWAPVLLVWGFLAGMTNEHTGPTAMLVAAGLVVLLWKRGRRQAWISAGALGLWLGYFALFFAPGQAKRYGGAAAKAGPLKTLLGRGLTGVQDVFGQLFWEAQLSLVLLVVGLLCALVAARRREQALAGPAAGDVGVTVLALAAAATVLLTILASPLLAERLFLTPALLVVVALTPVVGVVLRERVARRFLLACALAAVAYHGVRVGADYGEAHAEFARRVAVLAAAPAGSEPEVPPYRRRADHRIFYGDDLDTFTHRQYVAHEYFGLAGIRLAGAGPAAEPTPPFTLDYRLTYDPPLDEAGWRAHAAMPTYTATYAEWMVGKIRRFLPLLTTIPGHRLVRIEVLVEGLGHLPELRGRELVWVVWERGAYAFPEGGVLVDDLHMPYFVLKAPNIPPGLDEAWLIGCGRTTPMPIRPHKLGLAMPWQPTCHGTYLAIACGSERCWLAATTWR